MPFINRADRKGGSIFSILDMPKHFAGMRLYLLPLFTVRFHRMTTCPILEKTALIILSFVFT